MSALVHLGGRNVVASEVPDGVVVQPEGQTYDGMFFYRMAVSPFSNAQRVDGVAFDAVGLRASRISYPTLASVVARVAGLSPEVALLVLNVVLCGLLAMVGSTIASALGRPWWWGMAVLAIPAVPIGIAFDLSDLTALLAVLVAVYGLVRSRWAVVGSALTVAVLTRESTLVVVLSVVLSTAIWWRREKARPPTGQLVACAVPLVVGAVWQCIVRARWGEFGWSSSGGENIVAPLRSLANQWRMFDPTTGAGAVRLFVLASVLWIAGLGWLQLLDRFRSRSVQGIETAAATNRLDGPLAIWLVLATGLFVCLGPAIMANSLNFARAGTELVTCAVLVALGSQTSPSRRGLAGWSLASFAAAGAVLWAWTVWSTTSVA